MEFAKPVQSQLYADCVSNCIIQKRSGHSENVRTMGQLINNNNKSVEMKGLMLSLLHLPFAFCISNLNFPPKFEIFLIHIFEFPAKNLDSIGVVLAVGGGVHGDNIGTSSFWY